MCSNIRAYGSVGIALGAVLGTILADTRKENACHMYAIQNFTSSDSYNKEYNDCMVLLPYVIPLTFGVIGGVLSVIYAVANEVLCPEYKRLYQLNNIHVHKD